MIEHIVNAFTNWSYKIHPGQAHTKKKNMLPSKCLDLHTVCLKKYKYEAISKKPPHRSYERVSTSIKRKQTDINLPSHGKRHHTKKAPTCPPRQHRLFVQNVVKRIICQKISGTLLGDAKKNSPTIATQRKIPQQSSLRQKIFNFQNRFCL